MNGSVVSVRMPKQLYDELEGLAEHEHYMGVSDAVRTIIRRKTEEKLTRFHDDIGKDEIIDELETLLERLKDE